MTREGALTKQGSHSLGLADSPEVVLGSRLPPPAHTSRGPCARLSSLSPPKAPCPPARTHSPTRPLICVVRQFWGSRSSPTLGTTDDHEEDTHGPAFTGPLARQSMPLSA